VTLPRVPTRKPWNGSSANELTLSPDGKTLATGGHGGTIRLWDTASGQPRRTLVVGPPLGRIFPMALTPDGRRLLTLNGNAIVSILHLTP
jgi:WD40 repeat protein